MNIKTTIVTAALILTIASCGFAQEEEKKGEALNKASTDLQQQLEDSVKELNALRATIGKEKVDMSRQLRALEAKLTEAKSEFQNTTRDLDGRNLDINNMERKIKNKQAEAKYLSTLLEDYMRGFEARLHIAEAKRHEKALNDAKEAVEDPKLDRQLLYKSQVDLMNLSVKRLEDLLAGDTFTGKALDEKGVVTNGTYIVLGPVALFKSQDGKLVGIADQRGSNDATALPYKNELDTKAATALVDTKSGLLPLDPTLGNAYKMEATEDTFLEHVAKGGAVMYPIFGMAGIALLIALFKWLSFMFLRKPSRRRTEELLDAVARGENDNAKALAARMKGPVGKMLTTGTDHLGEPKELIEEVMYENVLRTESKLQSLLPFIAVCAASAPLLGLLGTVTGIINTFKMITVFGSGDVKSLSGGISEALITTKFGLIVAIPSLLLHAFLSRKAKRVTNQMETTAIAFVNRASLSEHKSSGGDADAIVRRQVNEALFEILSPMPADNQTQASELSN